MGQCTTAYYKKALYKSGQSTLGSSRYLRAIAINIKGKIIKMVLVIAVLGQETHKFPLQSDATKGTMECFQLP